MGDERRDNDFGTVTAFGNNRSNGRSLGLWARNASNVLSNANGNNWRSRASMRESEEKQRSHYLNLKHHTDGLALESAG